VGNQVEFVEVKVLALMYTPRQHGMDVVERSESEREIN
jgi:hypothetical protein